MFRDARNENKRLYWIEDHVWNDLLSHWNAPEYRSKCAQAKKNWASEKGGCMHTGGSISLQDHAIRLVYTLKLQYIVVYTCLIYHLMFIL